MNKARVAEAVRGTFPTREFLEARTHARMGIYLAVFFKNSEYILSTARFSLRSVLPLAEIGVSRYASTLGSAVPSVNGTPSNVQALGGTIGTAGRRYGVNLTYIDEVCCLEEKVVSYV